MAHELRIAVDCWCYDSLCITASVHMLQSPIVTYVGVVDEVGVGWCDVDVCYGRCVRVLCSCCR